MNQARIELVPRPIYLPYQQRDTVAGIVVLKDQSVLDSVRIVFRGQRRIGIGSKRSDTLRDSVDMRVAQYFETSQTLSTSNAQANLRSAEQRWAFEFTFPETGDGTEAGPPLPPSCRISTSFWQWSMGETPRYWGEVIICYELIVYFKPSKWAAQQQVLSKELPFCPFRTADSPNPLFARKIYPLTGPYPDAGKSGIARSMKSIFKSDPPSQYRFRIIMELPHQVVDYEPIPLTIGLDQSVEQSTAFRAPRPAVVLRELTLEFERKVELPHTAHQRAVAGVGGARRIVNCVLVYTEEFSISVDLGKHGLVIGKRTDLRRSLPPNALLLTCLPLPTFQTQDVVQKYGLKVKFAVECERRTYSGEIDDRAAELVVLPRFRSSRVSPVELGDAARASTHELDSAPISELPVSNEERYGLEPDSPLSLNRT